jgi:hypothetical protein
MNQHEWVYGCYAYYLENYIEPGNPEDGVWEAAHWPVPQCLGGTKTILLLKQHHAVQGVLQSEEWQHPCVFGWEKAYLTGVLLDQCLYWMKVQRSSAAKVAASKLTSEEMSRRITLANRRMTSEQRSERSRRAAAALTPEQRSERSRLGNARRTPEQRSNSARHRHATVPPEERSEIVRRGWETRRRNAGR